MPLWRSKLTWEDNIKIELTGDGMDGFIWLRIMAHWRSLVNTVMKFRVL